MNEDLITYLEACTKIDSERRNREGEKQWAQKRQKEEAIIYRDFG